MLISVGFSKPTIKIVTYQLSNIPNFVYQMVADKLKAPIISSKRFNVIEENKLFYNEKKIELAFGSKDLLLSESKNLNYEIVISLNNYTESKTDSFEASYVSDNKNGEYALVGFGYVRVYKGNYYSYNSKTDSYELCKNGDYVKGYDGKYYIPIGFYDKISQNVVYHTAKLALKYKVIDFKTGSILDQKSLNEKAKIFESKIVSLHPYIKQSQPLHLLYEKLLKPLDIYSFIKKDFLIKAKIIKVLDKTDVILDQGIDNGGVTTGQYYKIADKSDLLGVLKVLHSFKNSSQAKFVYLRSPDTKINVGSYVKEFEYYNPLPFHLSFDTTSISTGIIGLSVVYSKYDLYKRPLSFLKLQYLPTLPSTKTYDFTILYSRHFLSFLKMDTYLGLKYLFRLDNENFLMKNYYLTLSVYPDIFSNENFWIFYNRIGFEMDYSPNDRKLYYMISYMIF